MKDLAFFLHQARVIKQYRAFMRLHKQLCISEPSGNKSPRAQEMLSMIRQGYERDASPEHARFLFSTGEQQLKKLQTSMSHGLGSSPQSDARSTHADSSTDFVSDAKEWSKA